jgi:hypothetical protein
MFLAIWGVEEGSFSYKKVFVKLPMYFLTVNTSILVAWWKYLKGERVIMWAPSER